MDVLRLGEAMSEGDENPGFLRESPTFQRPWHWVYFFVALLLFPTLLFSANMIEDGLGRAGAILWLLMIHTVSIIISALLLREEITYGLVASIILSAFPVFFLLRSI